MRAILGPPLYMYKRKGEEGEGILERGSGGKPRLTVTILVKQQASVGNNNKKKEDAVAAKPSPRHSRFLFSFPFFISFSLC